MLSELRAGHFAGMEWGSTASKLLRYISSHINCLTDWALLALSLPVSLQTPDKERRYSPTASRGEYSETRRDGGLTRLFLCQQTMLIDKEGQAM